MRTCLPLLFVLAVTACSAPPEDESTGETSEALVTGPDLAVTKITTPTSVSPGARMTIVATVCNQGTDFAPPTKVDLYVSTDTKLDAPDPLVGSAYLNALPAGGCADASLDTYAPWGDGAFYPIGKVDPTNQIVESNETNNQRVGAVFGIGNRPDLVVKSVSGPANVLPGAPITATANVCNQGTTPSNSIPLAFELSTDAAITTADTLLANAMAPNLMPGQCANVSAMGTAPPGSFTLGAIIDPQNFVPELVETNNALAGKTIGVGSGPDLVVTAISHPSAIDSMGGSATFGVTVCNQGTSGSPYTFAELHLSTDSTINASDPVIGAVSVGPLSAGACQTVTANNFGPSAFLPQGAYYLGAIVDPQNNVPELQEGNDAFNAGLVGFGHAPDLVVSSVTGPKSIANAPWVAHASVCNQGTAPAYGAIVELYLSADTSITTGDSFAGWTQTPNLDPGACATVDINGSMPFMPPNPSAQYLGAIVDSQNRVPELIETNNTRAGALTGVGYGPDFVISAISAPAVVAGPFDATVTVCNQGTAPGITEVTLFLSPDKTFTPNDPTDQQAGRSPAFSIDAGQCTNVKVPANASPGPQGTMYLGAISDLNNATPELIESNNVSGARVIGVGYGPDLYVRVTSAPASVTLGPPFSATFRVCNQGTAPSQGSSFTAYTSPDATISTDDMRASMPNWVPSLAPGACASSTLSVSIPYDPNATSFYLGAIMDPSPSDLVPSNDASPGRVISITR